MDSPASKAGGDGLRATLRGPDGEAPRGGAAAAAGEAAAALTAAISDAELMRRLGKVGLPSYPMMVVSRCVALCSAAFVGQLGDTSALAAVGLANVVTNVTGYTWLWGLSGAVSTMSAQDWGARNYRAVGVTMQRGFWILVCFADLPLIFVWLSSRRLLEAVGQHPDVASLVGLYSSVRFPGILFMTANVVLTRTLACMSNIRINLLASLGVAVLNVTLSATLIPRLGFVGAPITATVCDAVETIIIAILAFQDADFRKCWPGIQRDAFRGWCAFLRVSCPSLALMGIEWWTWDLQNLLAGLVSPLAQATQAVTPALTDLQYCLGQALSNAAATVVGNLLGEGRARAAARCCRLVMLLCFVAMTLQGLLFLLLRHSIARVFTQDREVRDSIERLLPLTLVFSFLDGNQAALTGIIQAAGRQYLAAPLLLVCYWVVGVPLGLWLAFGQGWGLEGLWAGMLVAVALHFASFAVAACRLDLDEVAREVQERAALERQRSLDRRQGLPREGGSPAVGRCAEGGPGA